MTVNEEKTPRIFKISDDTFKILCQADKKNFDPTTGLENIVNMFIALNGPIDFKALELARAKIKAQKCDLIESTTFNVDSCKK